MYQFHVVYDVRRAVDMVSRTTHEILPSIYRRWGLCKGYISAPLCFVSQPTDLEKSESQSADIVFAVIESNHDVCTRILEIYKVQEPLPDFAVPPTPFQPSRHVQPIKTPSYHAMCEVLRDNEGN